MSSYLRDTTLERIKELIKTSYWMYPVRWIWALVWLPRLLLRIASTNQRLEAEIASTNQRLEAEIASTNQRLEAGIASTNQRLEAEIAGMNQRQDVLATNPQLAFSLVREAEPFITRAESRHGRSVNSLKLDEKQKAFCSYFSEIWGDGYELTRRRQYEAYLPYIPKERSERFLDIGCGAGEFVEFLEGNGIRALGLDSDPREVERGKARGLNIIHAEALDFLNATENIFAGISLIEVIEHVPLGQVHELIQSASDKLTSNGILLIETINIRHPLALTGFYTDPTHVRPMSDDYLSFLMQWSGFKDVQIVYTNPAWVPGTSRHDLTRIYYNYAIVGHRK